MLRVGKSGYVVYRHHQGSCVRLAIETGMQLAYIAGQIKYMSQDSQFLKPQLLWPVLLWSEEVRRS